MSSGKTITVREYEYITAKKRNRDRCHFLGKGAYDELREFILKNRADDEDNPLELMRLCSPPGIGEAIQLQNYVGVVELHDGMRIEVLPKIKVSKKDRDREIFLRMLRELGAGVSFKALNSAHLRSAQMPLFEVFISMFVDEAARLVRIGLRSAYVEQKSEEQFVRGKMDFTREVKKNPAHAERVNVIHDEYLVNRPENRLIKTTLLKLRGMSRNNENIRRIRRVLVAFDEVGVSYDVGGDFKRCANSRGTSMYRDLLGWCRVFLRHESFTMFRGDSVASALLFPMETIFESYVGNVLLRKGTKGGRLRKVRLQAQEEWLYDKHRHRIQLKPDILCECRCKRRVVLDTKWKRVYGNRRPSTADMHQMYAYGQRYAREEESLQHVMLLYPLHEEVDAGLCPAGRHVSSDGVQVDVFYVDLEDMDGSMEVLIRLIEDPSALEE